MNWSMEIIAFRRRHGLNQADFAELMGVDQATVSRWERGVNQPNRNAWLRLRSVVLNLSIGDEGHLDVALALAGSCAVCPNRSEGEPAFTA